MNFGAFNFNFIIHVVAPFCYQYLGALKKFFQKCPLEQLETIEETSELIQKLLFNKKERNQRIKNQLLYVESAHLAPILSKKLFDIYNELKK